MIIFDVQVAYEYGHQSSNNISCLVISTGGRNLRGFKNNVLKYL